MEGGAPRGQHLRASRLDPRGKGDWAVPSDTLTIVDNRTGREYSLPIVDGAIRATDLARSARPRATAGCSRTTRPS